MKDFLNKFYRSYADDCWCCCPTTTSTTTTTTRRVNTFTIINQTSQPAPFPVLFFDMATDEHFAEDSATFPGGESSYEYESKGYPSATFIDHDPITAVHIDVLVNGGIWGSFDGPEVGNFDITMLPEYSDIVVILTDGFVATTTSSSTTSSSTTTTTAEPSSTTTTTKVRLNLTTTTTNKPCLTVTKAFLTNAKQLNGGGVVPEGSTTTSTTRKPTTSTTTTRRPTTTTSTTAIPTTTSTTTARTSTTTTTTRIPTTTSTTTRLITTSTTTTLKPTTTTTTSTTTTTTKAPTTTTTTTRITTTSTTTKAPTTSTTTTKAPTTTSTTTRLITTTTTTKAPTTTTTTLRPTTTSTTTKAPVTTTTTRPATTTTTKAPVLTTTTTKAPVITTTTTLAPITSTTQFVCPSCAANGYVSVANGTICQKESIIAATQQGTPATLVKKNGFSYGLLGMYLYTRYAIDGRAINAAGAYDMSTGYQVRSNPYWRNGDGATGTGSDTIQGPLNRSAVWSQQIMNNQNVGFAYCFAAPTARTYYVGVGSDNYVRIYLDGVLLVDQGINREAMDIDHIGRFDNRQSTFYVWHVYPVTMTAGNHVIEVLGHNVDQIASIGVQIYNNTASQIINATSNANLNIVFDSNSRVNQPVTLGDGGLVCPDGYALDPCMNPIRCVQRAYYPCGGSPSTTTSTTKRNEAWTLTNTGIAFSDSRMVNIWFNAHLTPIPNGAFDELFGSNTSWATGQTRNGTNDFLPMEGGQVMVSVSGLKSATVNGVTKVTTNPLQTFLIFDNVNAQPLVISFEVNPPATTTVAPNRNFTISNPEGSTNVVTATYSTNTQTPNALLYQGTIGGFHQGSTEFLPMTSGSVKLNVLNLRQLTVNGQTVTAAPSTNEATVGNVAGAPLTISFNLYTPITYYKYNATVFSCTNCGTSFGTANVYSTSPNLSQGNFYRPDGDSPTLYRIDSSGSSTTEIGVLIPPNSIGYFNCAGACSVV